MEAYLAEAKAKTKDMDEKAQGQIYYDILFEREPHLAVMCASSDADPRFSLDKFLQIQEKLWTLPCPPKRPPSPSSDHDIDMDQ